MIKFFSFLFFFFLASLVHAFRPSYLSYIIGVSEKHEFYKNNQPVEHPKNSWQLLFALEYLDEKMKMIKDCVFYRVPGDKSGSLKFISVLSEESCMDQILKPGTAEMEGIKSLQYAILDNKVEVFFTLVDFSSKRWIAKLKNKSSAEVKRNGTSSAEFKTDEIIFLAPETLRKPSLAQSLPEGFACHQIADDCQELSPSVCSDCLEGWYEIPTGCKDGPKFCGRLSCGKKNEPACRRGMKWQKREDHEFNCRLDDSFAYCSGDLKVTCEGRKAFCR